MAAAAQNALPGEALYPIKRGLENAEAGLATRPGRARPGPARPGRQSPGRGRGPLRRLRQPEPGLRDHRRLHPAGHRGLASCSMSSIETPRPARSSRSCAAFASDNLAELQRPRQGRACRAPGGAGGGRRRHGRIDQAGQAACPTCADGLHSLQMPPLFLTAVEARDAMDAVEPGEARQHPPGDHRQDAPQVGRRQDQGAHRGRRRHHGHHRRARRAGRAGRAAGHRRRRPARRWPPATWTPMVPAAAAPTSRRRSTRRSRTSRAASRRPCRTSSTRSWTILNP